jgi:hypothetical protein
VVRNVGDVALTHVTVVDDRLGSIGAVARLAPGHAMTLRATRILSADDVWVTNVASVRATDPTGASVDASDEASVSLVAASGGSAGGAGSDGTAFTGTAVTRPFAALVALALAGLVLVRVTRRSA